ncbi:collagen alpha-1(I) chain-like [Canis lupus familiaris]|uniref:collagen alpha-1(I) chain-like n=1 Tax=Canis lupus familiaris TaxID=9615 RepID=UPI0018F6672A|nr:collagen alpha-1(I) chain-like [Canis lupus familiaris]XP_038516513.1 collagen alpha-1(I) chain-like [Canis lupus familiaris]
MKGPEGSNVTTASSGQPSRALKRLIHAGGVHRRRSVGGVRGHLDADQVRVVSIRDDEERELGEVPGGGGPQRRAQVAQGTGRQRLERTGRQPATGGLRSPRASQSGPPPAARSPQPAAARGPAGRGRRGPSAPHAPPSPPGGSAAPGAECGPSRWRSPSPVAAAGGPGPCGRPPRRSGARLGIRTSPGPGQSGHRGCRARASLPGPERSPRGPGPRCAPDRPAPGGGDRAPGLPALRGRPPRRPVPPAGVSGAGAGAGAGAAAAGRCGEPGGRAACAGQRRPCVPYAASGARPPLFSFPGSLAVSVRGSARAHKELRRRPGARPRGRSRRRRGGGARASWWRPPDRDFHPSTSSCGLSCPRPRQPLSFFLGFPLPSLRNSSRFRNNDLKASRVEAALFLRRTFEVLCDVFLSPEPPGRPALCGRSRVAVCAARICSRGQRGSPE